MAKEAWCTKKQTGSHKSYPPVVNMQNIVGGIFFPAEGTEFGCAAGKTKKSSEDYLYRLKSPMKLK